MHSAEIFIAYAPRGAGLRAALAYLEDSRDVYGWFTGPRHDTSVAACYFVIEEFHANTQARYVQVEHTDLHGRWALVESRRHDLAQMQEIFAREWLFHRDDARAAAELSAYNEAELAAGDVNLRFAQLARLAKSQPNWTYYSPHFERSVLRYVSSRWPLEYRLHEGERARARAAGPRP